jgi:hypothetical protein
MLNTASTQLAYVTREKERLRRRNPKAKITT